MSFRYFGKQPFASGVRLMGKSNIRNINSSAIVQSGGFAMTGFMYANSEFSNGVSQPVVVNHSGTASYDAFLSVYDPNLSLRWVTTISASGGALFNNVQSLSDGSFICNGYYNGPSASFRDPSGNIVLTLNRNGNYSLQPIWVKYDSSGNIVWAHQTSFVGTSDGISDANLSSSSLNFDESTINIMGWVRFSSGSSDFNFGNGVILPRLDYVTNDYTEVSYVVNVDASTGLVNNIVSFEISNSIPLGWQGPDSFGLVWPLVLLNYGSLMSLSESYADNKSSLIGGNYNSNLQAGGQFAGIYGWSVELFRNSQNSINTTTPFATSAYSNGRSLSPFISQYNHDTLSPDWVITIGNSSPNKISNVSGQKNIINQIHRDSEGNTYFSIETQISLFNTTPSTFVRYPNNYQSQPFVPQSDSVYIVKLDNQGDVVWFKRIIMSGNVGQSSFYPSFKIVGNTLIVSSQVKPVTTWTYSAGDPEQLIVTPSQSNTHIHHSKWDKNTGKLLGVDLNKNVSTGSINSSKSSDSWLSGINSGKLLSFGTISATNFAGDDIADINGTVIPSSIASESVVYTSEYDSNGVNTNVSTIARSLVSAKRIGGSDISVF